MLTIEDIKYRYKRTGCYVIDGMTATLEPGRIHLLLGNNGVGKTTLLRLMAGLIYPKAGHIRLDGKEVRERAVETLGKTAYVSDIEAGLNIKPTAHAALVKPFYKDFSDEILQEAMKMFAIDDETTISSMSLGQRKKYYISLALAKRPRLMLLDEPTNGLDIVSKEMFRKAIVQFTDEEQVIVISTHQTHDVGDMWDNLIVMKKGEPVQIATRGAITDNLVFENATATEGALYAKPSPIGNRIVRKKEECDEDSAVDIELLYDAILFDKVNLSTLRERS